MFNKLFAFFVFGVLMFNSVGAVFADTKGKKKSAKNQANALVALLPASDGAAAFDVKRFFDSALPQILSGNQPMLAKILAQIDEMKTKTGIDVRQFEQVAVGVGINKVTATEFDFAPVALMRGQINAPALIALAKIAANGKYREEKAGDKTIYIFNLREAAADKIPADDAEKAAQAAKFLDKVPDEIAVAAFDANTLAVGTPARVNQTLTTKTRIAADVSGLLGRNQNSVMTFASKIPGGMSSLLPLDNDELGKNIDAIQYLYGSADVVGANANLQISAKTLKNEQAQSLLETLQGLQGLGKMFLGSSKKPQNQVYGRFIDSVKLTRSLNVVNFNLDIPQTDIDVLIGEKK